MYLAKCEETPIIVHRIMTPVNVSEGHENRKGTFAVEEVVAQITTEAGETVDVTMMSKWEVRKDARIEKAAAEPSVNYRTARDRHVFPYCERRYGQYSRSLRQWKNCGSAPVGKMGGRERDYFHRLRRTR